MNQHDPHNTHEIISRVSGALDGLESVLRSAPEIPENDAPQGVFEGLEQLCAESGCRGLAEAIAALDRVIAEAGGVEHLYPSTIDVVVDAITGARELVESISLGDLQASLEPELIRMLRRIGTEAPDAGGAAGPEHPESASSTDQDQDFESPANGFTDQDEPDPANDTSPSVAADDALQSPTNGFASPDGETGGVSHTTPDPNQALDPTGGGMPDPNQALDPTGGAMPDPNQALDATGGAMPDPNQALDPTGGAMPDPNQALDPTGGAMPDPNQALDPTGGAMPDPNQALDPTGGAMPDPNQALDPTGGAMPDPNQALDPTGGAMPDPNQALDPTGGAMPDPNQALDPTGGAMPDPNQALDPTGGAMPDPNQALDPTGGAMPGEQADAEDEVWGSYPLTLTDAQAEMLQFMVTDVRRTVEELEPVIAEAEEFSTREDASSRLIVLGDELGKLAEFFELSTFAKLVDILQTIGRELPQMGDDGLPELLMRLRALASLIEQYCGGLEVGFEQKWPLKTFTRRIELLLAGKRLHPDLVGWHANDAERLLELDGVVDGVETPPRPPSDEDPNSGAGSGQAAPRSSSAPSSSAGGQESKVQTIRVEKSTIDRLLDIQRQLVLNKNYFLEATGAATQSASCEATESMAQRAAEYSRLTEQLRHCLDQTRVQPVGALLERFERVVRDVASLGDRQVEYIIEGAATPMDKFMIDRLADPLGRLLRHIAGHAIEPVSERESSGKPAAGQLRVRVDHEGSHVGIVLEHDGVQSSTEQILERAQAFDHVSIEDLRSLPAREVLLLPYRDWFSDSELSGIAEELQAIGVTIEEKHLRSGRTHIRLRMLVEGAVLAVISIRAGDAVYALPIQQIDEIMLLEPDSIRPLNARPTIMFRGDPVLLLDPTELFARGSLRRSPNVAVIFRSRDARYALRGDAVLGSSEIVLERLGLPAYEGPFLGGAIRNDGTIALVVDCERVPEYDKAHHGAAQQSDVHTRTHRMGPSDSPVSPAQESQHDDIAPRQ